MTELSLTLSPARLLADRLGRIVATNDELLRLSGRSSLELSSGRLIDLVRGPELVESAWGDLFDGRRPRIAAPATLLCADGRQVSVKLDAKLLLAGWGTSGAAMVELEEAMVSVGKPGTDRMLEGLLSGVSDGVVAVDPRWRILHLNARASAHLRLRGGELVGGDLWDALRGGASPALEAALRRAMVERERVSLREPTASGSALLDYRIEPKPWGIAVYSVDSSESVRLAWWAGDRQYRSMFEASLEAMLLTDPESGKVLAANAAACELLGCSREQARSLERDDLIDSSATEASMLLEGRWEGARRRREIEIKRRDGTTFTAEVSVSLFFDERGRHRSHVVMRDVSERARTENALRTLANAGAVLSGSLDSDTTLQSLARLLVPDMADGCVVDLVEGQQLRRVAAAHRTAEGDALLAGTRGTARPLSSDPGSVTPRWQHQLLADVSDRWLASLSPGGELSRGGELSPSSAVELPLLVRGQGIGVLSLFRSGARRRFTEADVPLLQGVADRAALAIDNARRYGAEVEATRVRDRVLRIVSHDLRNPLTAIAYAARLLAGRGRSRELMAIKRAAEHAGRLIDDLLVMASLETSSIRLQRRAASIGRLLHDVELIHRPLAERKSVELCVRCAPSLPSVSLDRHRVMQMLGNLVGNAIKFTRPGGQVSITAGERDGRLTVMVTDTGPGIRPEDLGRLFERFWQGSEARRSRAGLGLGLAIAKGIAEAHGGQLDVDSELGEGTRFTFSMLIADAAPPRPPVSRRSPSEQGERGGGWHDAPTALARQGRLTRP